MSTATRPIPGPAQHSPEWLAVHKTYLTASALPAIMGVSPWKTAFEQAAEMTGLKEPFQGNEHTARGTRYEGAIAADYAETAGVEIEYPVPLFFHPTIPYLAASPDAIVKASPEYGAEVKFTMSKNIAAELGEEDTDSLPKSWLVQSHGQMDVMNWDRVDFAVLLYGRLKIYRVNRSEKLMKTIHQQAERFMGLLAEGKLPEPDFGHQTTVPLLKSLYNSINDEEIELGADLADAWEHYQALGKDAKEIEDKRKEHQARILAAMKTAGMGWLPDGRLLVRSEVCRKSYTVAETSYIQLREKKARK